MASELIINVTPYESRVALLENGNVVELYIERDAESSLIGNIYKGRVIKVLPGMGAAFVDIGLERSAFLYVADVVDHNDDFYTEWQKDDNGGHPCLFNPAICLSSDHPHRRYSSGRAGSFSAGGQAPPERQGRPPHLPYHLAGPKFSINAYG